MKHEKDENAAFNRAYKRECERMDEDDRIRANSALNRTIKFRGKTINDGWVYGNLIVLRKSCNGTPQGAYISSPYDQPFAYAVQPKTVGQFTEHYDKNKIEIYEGDIIKRKTEKSDKTEQLTITTVCNNIWNEPGLHKCQLDKRIEIVGNIHDD